MSVNNSYRSNATYSSSMRRAVVFYRIHSRETQTGPRKINCLIVCTFINRLAPAKLYELIINDSEEFWLYHSCILIYT